MDEKPSRIRADRVEARFRDHVKASSGTPAIKTLPSYLTNADTLEVAAHVRALAETAAEAGLCFHFWELFLNSGLYKTGGNEALYSSHDRLTVSYRFEWSADRGLVASPHAPSIDEEKVHSNTKSLKQVKSDIFNLRTANRRYRSNGVGISHYDKLYEYFRYFCLNTFIHWLINPHSYGFQVNGIDHYSKSFWILMRMWRATRRSCSEGLVPPRKSGNLSESCTSMCST